MFEAEAHGMGVVIMRPLTSGTFQKLMRGGAHGPTAFSPPPDPAQVHRLLLSYVLSNPHVDVAIVGMRHAEEVMANDTISDDATARLDLVALHHRFVS